MKQKFMLICLIAVIFITGCGKKDSVVIYSSMEEERNQALTEQLKEKYPDIKVNIQSIATGNSAAKIKTERTKVEADIVVDLETAHMENLKENFADLSSFDKSIFLEGVNPDGTNNYLAWSKYHMSVIIDNKYFEEHNLEIPTSYDDLLKSEYKDLIAMPDPTTSGTGYGFYLNVVNLMGEDEAVEYFKKLSNNIREFTTSGSGPIKLLKQGEIAIAMGMTFQGVTAYNEGYDFSIIKFATGTPYNTTSFGIIKGRETDENVKTIFNFLLTDFIKYDKEHFLPDIILVDQENKVDNYPTDLVDANMDGITSVKVKENLIEKWADVGV